MFTPRYQRTLAPIVGLVASLLFSGCASETPLVNEFLDTGTGATITANNAPLVLYRDNPARAAYAKNFVHVGPIQVNTMGNYRYYLWIGVWSTIETPDPAQQRDGLESVTLFVDGEPLPLEIKGWTPDAIGMSQPAYLKPVASAADAYYQVTADQVRLIAESRDLRLRTSGTSPREFQLWYSGREAHRGLNAFLTNTLN